MTDNQEAVPTTKAGKAYMEALRAAILPPEIAKMLAPDGRQVLLALVEPDGVATALSEAEAEARQQSEDTLAELRAELEHWKTIALAADKRVNELWAQVQALANSEPKP